jgi:HK97 family phage prohead protease
MLTKSNNFELKDFDQKKGIVTFYFSAFGNRDSDGDVIENGAFKKTFEENRARIKHFKNHDPYKTPGRILELQEDTKGAFAISQLVKTTLGRDTLIEYEEGIITEHSMGFNVIKEELDQFEGVNKIKELRLWEVSSLNAWGANSMTNTVGVKNANELIGLIKKLNKVLTNTNISDEGGERLQNELKTLSELLKSLDPPKAVEPKDDKLTLEALKSFRTNLKL